MSNVKPDPLILLQIQIHHCYRTTATRKRDIAGQSMKAAQKKSMAVSHFTDHTSSPRKIFLNLGKDGSIFHSSYRWDWRKFVDFTSWVEVIGMLTGSFSSNGDGDPDTRSSQHNQPSRRGFNRVSMAPGEAAFVDACKNAGDWRR